MTKDEFILENFSQKTHAILKKRRDKIEAGMEASAAANKTMVTRYFEDKYIKKNEAG